MYFSNIQLKIKNNQRIKFILASKIKTKLKSRTLATLC